MLESKMPKSFEFITAAELCAFAHALVQTDQLPMPTDVVYFFEKPHKYAKEFQTWDECGRPGPEDAGWKAWEKAMEDNE
jgi:hypothetical protein